MSEILLDLERTHESVADAQLTKKLDKFDVIILDDIGYVQQSRDEMEVLFTLLADMYERKSLMISSNLVFSKWGQILKDPMTTMAAVDRLIQQSWSLQATVLGRMRPRGKYPE